MAHGRASRAESLTASTRSRRHPSSRRTRNATVEVVESRCSTSWHRAWIVRMSRSSSGAGGAHTTTLTLSARIRPARQPPGTANAEGPSRLSAGEAAPPGPDAARAQGAEKWRARQQGAPWGGGPGGGRRGGGGGGQAQRRVRPPHPHAGHGGGCRGGEHHHDAQGLNGEEVVRQLAYVLHAIPESRAYRILGQGHGPVHAQPAPVGEIVGLR